MIQPSQALIHQVRINSQVPTLPVQTNIELTENSTIVTVSQLKYQFACHLYVHFHMSHVQIIVESYNKKDRHILRFFTLNEKNVIFIVNYFEVEY